MQDEEKGIEMIQKENTGRQKWTDGENTQDPGTDAAGPETQSAGAARHAIRKWMVVGLVFAGAFSMLAVLPEPERGRAETNTIADQIEARGIASAEHETNTMADQLAASSVVQAGDGETNTIADQMQDQDRQTNGQTNTIADQIEEGERPIGVATSDDG